MNINRLIIPKISIRIRMKVFALVVLVIGSSSGLGSGPYLPSGWKPSGPAFNLPTEIEKPVAIPLKDVPVQESESSGSSFLREYGPPKVQVEETNTAQVQVESETSSSDAQVSQDITQQALPEPITEQAFVVIDTTLESQNQANAEVAQEVVTEQITSVAETTESQSNEEQTTQSEALIEGRALTEVESQTESSLAADEGTTEKLVETTEAEIAEVAAVTQEVGVANITQEAVEEAAQVEVTKQETDDSNNIVAAVAQKIEEVAEIRAVEAGVNNIAEALVNLENEIKAQQVQTNEEVSELRTVTQGSTPNSPEGFLEYGPPGFTEYGPPKGDLKVVPEAYHHNLQLKENLSVTNEINAARRRRFSPKFRAVVKKN